MTPLTFSVIVLIAYVVVVGALLISYYRPRADEIGEGDGRRPTRRSGRPST